MSLFCKSLGRRKLSDSFARCSSSFHAIFIILLLAGLVAPAAQAKADLKFDGVNYMALKSVSRNFGMKHSGVSGGKKIVLTSEWTRLEFQTDRRYFLINGWRVYLGHPALRHGSDLYISRGDFEHTLKPIVTPRVFTPVPKLYRIVIDPGHGGKDPGTQNKKYGLIEKAVALDISKRLQKILSKKGYDAILTRQSDKFIELAERPAIANRKRADLFISVHANATASSTVKGVETFIFTPKNHPSTRNSSVRASDKKVFPGNRNNAWNALIGFYVQRELIKELKTSDRGLKRARMAVLKTLNCPGLLVETGFFTNPSEADKLKSSAYRQKIAESIATGILQYQKSLNRLRGK